MRDEHREPEERQDTGTERAPAVPLVSVYAHRPAGYEGSCLRPLGLCELGGCCDACWYSPEHPRHAKKKPS
jgi:hypothetical protein